MGVMRLSNYCVIIDGIPRKTYPYKIQAIIHLYEAKKIYQCFRDFGDEWDGKYIAPNCSIEILGSSNG